MDRRERMNDPLVAIRAALDGLEANIWTALPAVVVDDGFSASKVTVSAQPTVMAQIRAPTAQNWTDVALPKCVDCPVIFPGGGATVLTFPIAVGDEGLLVFASRCIDSWWQNGAGSSGAQPQAELRMHDLSDGFFIPLCFSNPKVPPRISTTTAQLRSMDGSTYVELDPSGQIVNIVAPGGVKITAPNTEITGTLKIDMLETGEDGLNVVGNISATGEVTGNGIPLSTHTHPVSDAPGETGPPEA